MKKLLTKIVFFLLVIGPIQALYFVWFPKQEDGIFTQIFITQIIIGLAILAYLFIDWLTKSKK